MSTNSDPCPRTGCKGRLLTLLSRDGSCVEGEVCGACAATWMFERPRPLPSAPRHDAGMGDHPAPTDATALHVCLGCHAPIPYARTFCPDCLQREVASPPPSPGGEDVGALLEHVERHGLDGTAELLRREFARLTAENAHLGEMLTVVRDITMPAQIAETEKLRAQLAAASDRYARAVADADEVRGRLVAERDAARGKALEEAAQYMLDHGGYIYSVDPVLRVRNHGEMAAAVRALAAPATKGGA